MDGERPTALHTGLGRNVELAELGQALSEPTDVEKKAPDIFRQLLEQAIRVSEQANAQALRMATDFAAVYAREQRLSTDFDAKLGELALLVRQSTRYAEDLATLLRLERELRR